MTLEEIKYHERVLSEAHASFKKDLTRYSYYKLHNRALSEDLVQDTFAKTWVYLLRGGKIVVMKSFLYRVLNNLIVDQYRKRKTVSLDGMIENGFEPDAEEGEVPTTEADGKSAVAAIRHLPLKYRRIMQMRFVDNLSIDEIAEATGQSKNCIAVQIHRGVKKIRTWYNGHSGSPMAFDGV